MFPKEQNLNHSDRISKNFSEGYSASICNFIEQTMAQIIFNTAYSQEHMLRFTGI